MIPPRVTDADVKAILATTMDTTPFIAGATVMVDQYVERAGWSDTLAFEIERWWSAHLTCLADPRLRDLRDGDTAVTYERGQPGQGLKSTSYGQQVLALDPTGTIASGQNVQQAWVRFF